MSSHGDNSFMSSSTRVPEAVGSQEMMDEEVNQFLMMEQQKASIRQQIQQLTDVCWEKCIDKPAAKLEGKTESCLENCVGRFLDTSMLILNRFSQVLEAQARR